MGRASAEGEPLSRHVSRLARVFTALLWIAFVGVPLAAVIARAWSGEISWLDPGVLAVARFAAGQAAVSAALSGVIGLGLGLWIGPRGGRTARALLALPYGVPTVVVGLAFVQLLGRTGWLARMGVPLDWAYSASGVVLAHVFLNAPWVALATAQARLGQLASRVTWLEADVTTLELPTSSIDLWHDRVAFHFLTDHADRARYTALAAQTVKPGGTVVIGTFAPDGPSRCSGLPVAQYSAEGLAEVFGPAFRLRRAVDESHRTPAGAEQRLTWAVLERV